MKKIQLKAFVCDKVRQSDGDSKCCGAENKIFEPEPQIRIAAPALAPAPALNKFFSDTMAVTFFDLSTSTFTGIDNVDTQ